MRILHIVEATFAGVGRHVVDLARAQASAGDEVHVAWSDTRASEQFLLDIAATPEVGWERLSLGRSPQPSDIAALQRLRSIIGASTFDVVHGHSTKGGILARALPRRRVTIVAYTPNAPYTMAPDLSASRRALVAGVERLLGLRTDLLIAVSPEERAHLSEIGVRPRRTAIAPNGISRPDAADRDEVRGALGLPLDVPVIGFVGRLDSQKSPLDLLSTFAQIASHIPDAHLAVVGDGPLAQKVAAAADRAPNLRPQIHLLGQQPGTWAMSAFDVFLLPSRYEGFPYVLIEAGALGIPIVTTSGANASLLADEGADVSICEIGAVDQLAAACIEGLRSTDARGTVKTHTFTVERMATAVGAAYRSCHGD